MKKFKNKIAVTGTPTLKKAFRDELLELGYEWKAMDREDFDCPYLINYWSGEFGLGNYPVKMYTVYKLPEQYDEALKAASEVDEEIPEYVEFIDTAHKGKIVKVVEWTPHVYCRVRFFNGDKSEPFKYLVKPSTKEAYDAQNRPVSETLILGTSNVKITIYKDGTIIAENKNGTIKMIKQLIEQMQNAPFIGKWDSIYTTIKIGCSTFTLDELKQIVTAYDKLNQLEW